MPKRDRGRRPAEKSQRKRPSDAFGTIRIGPNRGRGQWPRRPSRYRRTPFDPFETTKQRGMGLGLSLSREIVRAHQGRPWLEHTSATGSTFVLELPDRKGILQ